MRTRPHGSHHIAWASRAPERGDRYAAIVGDGLRPSPIMDRTYFRSIYFREPSGVLFEIATDAPGFPIDEPVEALSTALRLPPPFEPRRAPIEDRVRPLRSPRDVASHA